MKKIRQIPSILGNKNSNLYSSINKQDKPIFDEEWDEKDDEYLVYIQMDNTDEVNDVIFNNGSEILESNCINTLSCFRTVAIQNFMYQYFPLRDHILLRDDGYFILHVAHKNNINSLDLEYTAVSGTDNEMGYASEAVLFLEGTEDFLEYKEECNQGNLKPYDCIDDFTSAEKGSFDDLDELDGKDNFDELNDEYLVVDELNDNQLYDDDDEWDEGWEESKENGLFNNKITKEERAKQIAIEFIEEFSWNNSCLPMLTRIFFESGWGATRLALSRFVSKGMTPREVQLAYIIKQYWLQNEQYHMSFSTTTSRPLDQSTPVYWFLSWPVALKIIIGFKSIPSFEEIVMLFDQLFDNWYLSSTLRQEFPSFNFYILRYFEVSNDGFLDVSFLQSVDDQITFEFLDAYKKAGFQLYDGGNNDLPSENVRFIYGELEFDEIQAELEHCILEEE